MISTVYGQYVLNARATRPASCALGCDAAAARSLSLLSSLDIGMVGIASCVCGPKAPYACAGCDVRLPHREPTVIAFVFHWDPAHVRSGNEKSTFERHANGLLTAHASLTFVNSTLPVHAIITGWHPPALVWPG